MEYLAKLLKSRTVKLALAQICGALIVWLSGQSDLKPALIVAAISVLQIIMRAITTEPIAAK